MNPSALTEWRQPETHDSACITITATVARAGKGNRRNVTSPPKTDTLSPPTTTAKETSLLSRIRQPDACCPSNSSPNCYNTETTSSFRCQASDIFASSRNRPPASSFINTAVSYRPPNSSFNLNNPKPLAFSPSSSRHLFFEAKVSASMYLHESLSSRTAQRCSVPSAALTCLLPPSSPSMRPSSRSGLYSSALNCLVVSLRTEATAARNPNKRAREPKLNELGSKHIHLTHDVPLAGNIDNRAREPNPNELSGTTSTSLTRCAAGRQRPGS
jgi:hypothetical protein